MDRERAGSRRRAWALLLAAAISAAVLRVSQSQSLSSVPSTPLPETSALLAISSALKSTSPGLWVTARWLQGSPVPPCKGPKALWKFITCNKNASVTRINLSARQTMGPALFGEFPWAQVSALTSLSFLDINTQQLTGPAFPDDMPVMPSMELLNLAYNQLSSLSEKVSQLPRLKSLGLARNGAMQGTLPSTLSALRDLAALDLSYTAVSGPFPETWTALTGLTTLNVQRSALSGPLPDTFSALTALEILNVPGNALTGTIPSSWASLNRTLTWFSVAENQLSGPFPAVILSFLKLKKVDIGFNQFQGPVPSSFWTWNVSDGDISSNFFNGTVPATIQNGLLLSLNCFSSVPENHGNSTQRTAADCASFYSALYPATPSPSSVNLGLILGLSLGVGLAVVVGALLLFRHLQQKNRLAKRLRKGTMQSTREFGLAELKSATKNWSYELGRGGYGSVYKAVFKDGTIVAVKRLDQISDQGDVEFIREVELLSRVHHRHLVNLLGFCGEKGERALVYEYMGLGSLYDHLHGECAKEQPLSWDSRIKIAIHVAFGIDYLHYGADPPLIHRDIKSANVLLSDDGYAKVADFGLCKEAPVGVTTDGTAQLVPEATEVKGSFGYLDPEYVNTSVLSEKSDVYSYGVVLLELITGKKSIHDWQPLAYWAEPYLEDPNKLEALVDPALEGEYDVHELQILCDIARSCTYDQAAMRPAIRDVAQALVENLGRVVASTASESDPSTYDSSEMASSSDPTESSNMSATFSAPSSEYSFRNAASEALLVGLQEEEEKEGKSRPYMMATGPGGNKPPVPVGKHFEDTV